MQTNWRDVEDELSSRERALCAYAEKLTLTPGAMSPTDLETLRTEGLDDTAILEATHVIGYFNHINRVADALGVDLESFMDPNDPRRAPRHDRSPDGQSPGR